MMEISYLGQLNVHTLNHNSLFHSLLLSLSISIDIVDTRVRTNDVPGFLYQSYTWISINFKLVWIFSAFSSLVETRKHLDMNASH